jgi:hypothetical protein
MNYISFTVSVFTLLFFVFLILSTLGQQQAFPETVKSLWSIGTSMPIIQYLQLLKLFK